MISNKEMKILMEITRGGELRFAENVHPRQMAEELVKWFSSMSFSNIFAARNLLLLARQIINEGVGSKEIFNTSLEEFLKEIGYESNYK